MSESSSEESLPSHSSLLSTWTAVPSLVMLSLTSVLTTKLDSSLVDKILETSRSTDRRKVTLTSLPWTTPGLLTLTTMVC